MYVKSIFSCTFNMQSYNEFPSAGRREEEKGGKREGLLGEEVCPARQPADNRPP